MENALLVVAYPTGRPADVLTLDKKLCEHYWNEWLKRLEAFNELKKSAEKQWMYLWRRMNGLEGKSSTSFLSNHSYNKLDFEKGNWMNW